MDNKCKSCKWWKPLDGSSKHEMVCLFCYLNGHSRARENDTCLEYQRREAACQKTSFQSGSET